jgi:hypothetical protein
MIAAIAERAGGHSLVPSELHRRLVRRIAVDETMTEDLAGRILDQAVAFLCACAESHTRRLAPSELVDIGWHAFILHTREYAEFCQRIAGRFLHHVPTEPGDVGAQGEAARATLGRTVAAIERAGFVVDVELWPSVTGKCNDPCSQCKNGCADDPPPATR